MITRIEEIPVTEKSYPFASAERDTREQVAKGFVSRDDADTLVETAVNLAKKRGLE